MAKKRIGIMGASGYTGSELLRLLAGHGGLEVAWATSRAWAGKPAAEAFPYLEGLVDLVFDEPDLDHLDGGIDAVVTALPHTDAMEAVGTLRDRGVRVVDLSADFRLDDAAVYERWYGTAHGRPELLDGAVYGLTEWNRDAVASAAVVANPGCYPTAALLALLPLVKAGVAAAGSVVIDAKSGVSGAGRSLKQGSLFCEVNEGLTPYLAGRHRHIPEIRQELEKAAGGDFPVTFTPHLLPLSRGLIETIYVGLEEGAGAADVAAAYGAAYGEEPFVRVAPAGKLPSLREAAGTNLCRIGFTDDPEAGRLIVVSAIDNLVKGAAGQALQNLNLMLGFSETEGLLGPGLYP
jgi:N-acetyl-gamma-glutamyl-phosphate reductase